MRCCNLKMLEKNERQSTQLLCLYRQFPSWLVNFQELETMLKAKFLLKGLYPSPSTTISSHLKKGIPTMTTVITE